MCKRDFALCSLPQHVPQYENVPPPQRCPFLTRRAPGRWQLNGHAQDLRAFALREKCRVTRPSPGLGFFDSTKGYPGEGPSHHKNERKQEKRNRAAKRVQEENRRQKKSESMQFQGVFHICIHLYVSTYPLLPATGNDLGAYPHARQRRGRCSQRGVCL